MACYFLQAGTSGAVKIGETGDPHLIIRRYQTYNHERLSIIRLIPGWHETEAWLHRHFDHLRIHGEWFRFHPEMLTIQPPPSTRMCAREGFACQPQSAA